jgi:hypothetical protein
MRIVIPAAPGFYYVCQVYRKFFSKKKGGEVIGVHWNARIGVIHLAKIDNKVNK